jgi:hypothetical protein
MRIEILNGPYSVVQAQAEKVYAMIEQRATGPARRCLREHHEDWLRIIFLGWENGEHWSRLDVGDVRWYDAERELEVVFEWYE